MKNERISFGSAVARCVVLGLLGTACGIMVFNTIQPTPPSLKGQLDGNPGDFGCNDGEKDTDNAYIQCVCEEGATSAPEGLKNDDLVHCCSVNQKALLDSRMTLLDIAQKEIPYKHLKIEHLDTDPNETIAQKEYQFMQKVFTDLTPHIATIQERINQVSVVSQLDTNFGAQALQEAPDLQTVQTDLGQLKSKFIGASELAAKLATTKAQYDAFVDKYSPLSDNPNIFRAAALELTLIISNSDSPSYAELITQSNAWREALYRVTPNKDSSPAAHAELETKRNEFEAIFNHVAVCGKRKAELLGLDESQISFSTEVETQCRHEDCDESILNVTMAQIREDCSKAVTVEDIELCERRYNSIGENNEQCGCNMWIDNQGFEAKTVTASSASSIGGDTSGFGDGGSNGDPVEDPALSVTIAVKSVADDESNREASPHEKVAYTITIKNTGNDPVENIDITPTFAPNGAVSEVEIVPDDEGGSCANPFDGQCSSIAGQATVVFTATYRVEDTSIICGEKLTLTTKTKATDISETEEKNEEVTMECIDLSIVTIEEMESESPNDTKVRIKVTVKNVGKGDIVAFNSSESEDDDSKKKEGGADVQLSLDTIDDSTNYKLEDIENCVHRTKDPDDDAFINWTQEEKNAGNYICYIEELLADAIIEYILVFTTMPPTCTVTAKVDRSESGHSDTFESNDEDSYGNCGSSASVASNPSSNPSSEPEQEKFTYECCVKGVADNDPDQSGDQKWHVKEYTADDESAAKEEANTWCKDKGKAAYSGYGGKAVLCDEGDEECKAECAVESVACCIQDTFICESVTPGVNSGGEQLTAEEFCELERNGVVHKSYGECAYASASSASSARRACSPEVYTYCCHEAHATDKDRPATCSQHLGGYECEGTTYLSFHGCIDAARNNCGGPSSTPSSTPSSEPASSASSKAKKPVVIFARTTPLLEAYCCMRATERTIECEAVADTTKLNDCVDPLQHPALEDDGSAADDSPGSDPDDIYNNGSGNGNESRPSSPRTDSKKGEPSLNKTECEEVLCSDTCGDKEIQEGEECDAGYDPRCHYQNEDGDYYCNIPDYYANACEAAVAGIEFPCNQNIPIKFPNGIPFPFRQAFFMSNCMSSEQKEFACKYTSCWNAMNENNAFESIEDLWSTIDIELQMIQTLGTLSANDRAAYKPAGINFNDFPGCFNVYDPTPLGNPRITETHLCDPFHHVRDPRTGNCAAGFSNEECNTPDYNNCNLASFMPGRNTAENFSIPEFFFMDFQDDGSSDDSFFSPGDTET